ncbi:hypothetical protein GCM10009558_049520 [Virgisporangium aurantiacum]
MWAWASTPWPSRSAPPTSVAALAPRAPYSHTEACGQFRSSGLVSTSTARAIRYGPTSSRNGTVTRSTDSRSAAYRPSRQLRMMPAEISATKAPSVPTAPCVGPLASFAAQAFTAENSRSGSFCAGGVTVRVQVMADAVTPSAITRTATTTAPVRRRADRRRRASTRPYGSGSGRRSSAIVASARPIRSSVVMPASHC